MDDNDLFATNQYLRVQYPDPFCSSNHSKSLIPFALFTDMPKQTLDYGRRWFAIHTYSGYEENVADGLRRPRPKSMGPNRA
jgi:hypothetical protein